MARIRVLDLSGDSLLLSRVVLCARAPRGLGHRGVLERHTRGRTACRMDASRRTTRNRPTGGNRSHPDGGFSGSFKEIASSGKPGRDTNNHAARKTAFPGLTRSNRVHSRMRRAGFPEYLSRTFSAAVYCSRRELQRPDSDSRNLEIQQEESPDAPDTPRLRQTPERRLRPGHQVLRSFRAWLLP
jgi:hypothetical protein